MAACERVLDEAGANWIRVRGSVEERLVQAIAAIEALERPRA
jgi:hypothetical protein